MGSKEQKPESLLGTELLSDSSFYRDVIAEFVATFLFLYVTILTVIGYKAHSSDTCGGVGILGIAWSFGGMIFILVYCTGGHINPAVTFGMWLARKVSLIKGVVYIVAQCFGAICGCGLVKVFHEAYYNKYGGGANQVAHGYSKGAALGAEIVGTFILLYTIFSTTYPIKTKDTTTRKEATDVTKIKDIYVLALKPLAIGFAVFMVHLATIPITGTSINPARSFGPAVMYNNAKTWDDHWIFWAGPFIGASIAAIYHQYVLGVQEAK